MTTHLTFLLLGLASGAVFASLAIALVVTQRSAGVVNFATGSLALVASYLFNYFRQGKLLLIIPGLPQSVKLADSLPVLVAVLLSLVLTALIGLSLHYAVFRPLRTAPTMARVVASVGLTVMFSGLIIQRVGTQTLSATRIFPDGSLKLFDIQIPKDRFYFATAVVVLALLLGGLYRFTHFGLVTRAVADSEKGSYVSGIRPDRVAAINWMISAVVAGSAGIMISSIVPLNPVAYSLFIIPALGAAILGGFQRLVPAVVGGLLIGMVQSELTYLKSLHKWLPQSGLPELVSVVLILLVLVVRARPLPSRQNAVTRPVAGAPRPQRIALSATVAGAAAIVVFLVMTQLWQSVFLTSLIMAVIALSMVVTTGYAGQVSLAQLTLAGVAAFLVGPLTDDWGIPFPLSPLLAIAVAVVVGVVLGLPALRVRGLPVAVVTLALAALIEAAWFQNSEYVSPDGIPVRGPRIFGLDLSVGVGKEFPRPAFGVFVIVVLVGAAAGVARLRRSRLGSAMLAVRADERAAAMSGVDVVRTKVAAFAIGSALAGLGGVMLAYKQGNISAEPFTVLLGLSLFASVYLAGITSIAGGIAAGLIAAGGIVFVAFDRATSLGSSYQTIVGAGLALAVVVHPEGFVGDVHRGLRRGLEKLSKSPATVPRELDPVGVRRGSIQTGSYHCSAEGSGITTVAPAFTGATRRRVSGDALAVASIRVQYGGVVAVDDVSISVPGGAIVGLIGPNGAGKTSAIDAITGFAPCTGSVSLGDRSLDGLTPHRRARAGLGRTFQSGHLYDELSVMENIEIGEHSQHRKQADLRDRLAVLELLGLDELARSKAGDLSHGQRQLVSVARALVGRPAVLLLDEPAAGLDTNESRWLGERLKMLRSAGTSILLIEHDIDLVLDVCDELHVLNFGKQVASGSPEMVRSDTSVVEAYLGRFATTEASA